MHGSYRVLCMVHASCPIMKNSFCMNSFWGPVKLNLPRAPKVLRPALLPYSTAQLQLHFSMCLYAWCHTELCVVPRRILCGNKIFSRDDMWHLTWYLHANLHNMRLIMHGQSMRMIIDTSTHHIIYDHAGKCRVANYVVLSVTLYFTGIGRPNKVDGKYIASN